MNNKISVVIVTYNRLEKLKKALSCYTNQSYKPSSIFVVDNCSTDGTSEFLDKWGSEINDINKKIIRTSSNLGGAGGFKIGFNEALNSKPDWVWVSDDDAYPQLDVLQIINDNINKKEYNNAACFCGTVYINTFDNISLPHRRYNKRKIIFIPTPVPATDYKRDHIIIEETTFVGSCYKASILKKAGLPNDKLFIYYDDTDHSHKINNFGKIVLLPKVKILHDTGKTGKKPNIICTWRDFYLTRNHTYTLKQYDTLTYIAYICYKAYKILLQYMKLKNKDVLKLHFIALHDGMNGKIGVHHIYKPGYEIQK